ncbi:MAG: thiazole synthase, partial [uncultured bacterium]
MEDVLIIGNHKFKSRLILGTGKFSSAEILRKTIEASETEMVTVALRRVDLNNPSDNLLGALDLSKIIFLPNTSGAQNASEAVRIARMAKATNFTDWVKLEITPAHKYLLPDGEETLKAASILVKEGFKVMPYINADPVLAKKLEEIGCVSVMPLGSCIGSNQGLKT